MSEVEEQGFLSPTVVRIRAGMWSGTCEDGAILPFPAGTDLPSNFDTMVSGDDKEWLRTVLDNGDTEVLIFTYCSGEGAILMGAVYFRTPGAETRVRYIRCDAVDDYWPQAVFSGIEPPYPLFGLEWLAAEPDAPILLVGSEEATDIVADLFPDAVVISFPGVASTADELDLHPLRGRTITIVPDGCVLNLALADELRLAIEEIGAVSVTITNGVVEDWDDPHAKWGAASLILL